MADQTRFQEEMAVSWKNNYQTLNDDTEAALKAVADTLRELSESVSEDDILQTIGQVTTDVLGAFTELVNAFANLFNSVANVITTYGGFVGGAVEVVKTVLPLL